jgi:pyruvate dehydrogenase complex dehydrogenase (E1) component
MSRLPGGNARPGDRRHRLRARLRRADPRFGAAPYTVLGTDGFGRSDTREKLRHFFEVDRHWITLAALTALAEEGR